jgi:DNA-binding response OmpR family regulator
LLHGAAEQIMNVLFFTENAENGRVVEARLNALIPDFQLEISLDAPDATGRLRTAGRFHAVILDCAPLKAEALGIIRALRRDNLPLAVIAIIAADDRDADARLMEAGADDYVLKHPGYIDSLAAALRRTCSLHDPAQGAGGAARILYASKPVDECGPQPEQESARQDFTHATSLLLRRGSGTQGARPVHASEDVRPAQSDAPLKALKSCKENEAMLKADFSAAQTLWEQQQKDLETRIRNAEAQRQTMGDSIREITEELNEQRRVARAEQSRLDQQLETLGMEASKQAEELREERGRTEQLRTALKQRLDKILRTCSRFEEAARTEQERHEDLARRHAAQLEQHEKERKECEEQLRLAREEAARLKEILRAAEARLKEQDEKLQLAAEQWETTRLALEQRRQAQEARLAQLEETILQLTAEHRQRLSDAEKSRAELESTATALADELRVTSESHRRAVEELRSVRSRWEAAIVEVEKRRKSLEEQLRIAYQRHQNPLKEHGGGPMQW